MRSKLSLLLFLSQTKYFKSFKISLFVLYLLLLWSPVPIPFVFRNGSRRPKHTHTANTYAHWVKKKSLCTWVSLCSCACRPWCVADLKRRLQINESSSNNWVKCPVFNQQLCWNSQIRVWIVLCCLCFKLSTNFFFFCYKNKSENNKSCSLT